MIGPQRGVFPDGRLHLQHGPIDLVIEGRPPLAVPDAAGWAAAHLAWTTWAMARGAGPEIADAAAWLKDNRELFDGVAWWLARELGVDPPPRLTERAVGW